MASTYHRLTSGTYSRWTGDKKTGKREEYDAFDPTKNVIENLSENEMRVLSGRVEEVSSKVAESKRSSTTAVLPAGTVAPSQVETEHVDAPIVPIPTTTESTTSATHETLLSKSVPEIESELRNINDVSALDAIQREENAGKQRIGVLKVIKSRREELSS